VAHHAKALEPRCFARPDLALAPRAEACVLQGSEGPPQLALGAGPHNRTGAAAYRREGLRLIFDLASPEEERRFVIANAHWLQRFRGAYHLRALNAHNAVLDTSITRADRDAAAGAVAVGMNMMAAGHGPATHFWHARVADREGISLVLDMYEKHEGKGSTFGRLLVSSARIPSDDPVWNKTDRWTLS